MISKYYAIILGFLFIEVQNPFDNDFRKHLLIFWYLKFFIIQVLEKLETFSNTLLKL